MTAKTVSKARSAAKAQSTVKGAAQKKAPATKDSPAKKLITKTTVQPKAKKVASAKTVAPSLATKATAVGTPVTPVMTADPDADKQVKVSEKDFIVRLTEKLTHFDAKMVLEAAMLVAGVARQEGNFKKREAREICLALIKRGGPAFAVGSGIYREVIG